jgi:hypothetical protein
MALNTARSFRLLSYLERDQEKVYSGAHSLDQQRFFNTNCLIYGHRPEQYEYLIRGGALPADRAFECEEDYARINRSWQTLLAPHLAYSWTRPVRFALQEELSFLKKHSVAIALLRNGEEK